MACKAAVQREVSQAKISRVLPWLLYVKTVLRNGPVDVVEDVQMALRVTRDRLKDKRASKCNRLGLAGISHLEAIRVSARVVWYVDLRTGMSETYNNLTRDVDGAACTTRWLRVDRDDSGLGIVQRLIREYRQYNSGR
jgi:hypothetical protein